MSTNNLVWYQFFFERRDLLAGVDIQLVTEFIRFMHHLKSPDGLAIFEPIQRPDSGACYYLSSPESYSNELKKIILAFHGQNIPPPNLEKLDFFIGKKIPPTLQVVSDI